MSLLPRDERTRRSPSPYKSGAPHRVRADKTKMQTLQLKPVLPDVAPKWHDSRNMNLKRLLQSGITGLRFRTRPWARAVVVKFGDGSAIQLHILLLLDTYTFMLHMP